MADETKHTPGPWGWYGSTYQGCSIHLATLHSGRRFIMGFKRRGTQGAEPTFQVNNRMVPASELVLFDVDRTVKGATAGKAAHSVYRYDFSEIDHPDARLIAASPDLLEAAQKALNYIANTEGELGITLGAGDALRAAIAKATGAAS